MSVSTDFISTGGGKLYIQPYVAGVLGTRTYFGITDMVTMSMNTDFIEHENTEGATTLLDKKVAKKKTATIKFSTAEISIDMLNRAFLGEKYTNAQGVITEQAVVIATQTVGGFYDVGYIAVTALIVKDSADLITYTEGTDYSFDKNSGYLEILEGTTIVDLAEIHLTVTATAYDKVHTALLANSSLVGRLVFISDPQSGEKFRYTFKKVDITSTGDLDLKSAEFMKIEFEGEVLVDDSVTDPQLSDYIDIETLPND